jgi:hypothetical protein
MCIFATLDEDATQITSGKRRKTDEVRAHRFVTPSFLSPEAGAKEIYGDV